MMTPAVLGTVLVMCGIGAAFDRREDEEWPNGNTAFGLFLFVGGIALIAYEVNWWIEHFHK